MFDSASIAARLWTAICLHSGSGSLRARIRSCGMDSLSFKVPRALIAADRTSDDVSFSKGKILAADLVSAYRSRSFSMNVRVPGSTLFKRGIKDRRQVIRFSWFIPTIIVTASSRVRLNSACPKSIAFAIPAKHSDPLFISSAWELNRVKESSEPSREKPFSSGISRARTGFI